MVKLHFNEKNSIFHKLRITIFLFFLLSIVLISSGVFASQSILDVIRRRVNSYLTNEENELDKQKRQIQIAMFNLLSSIQNDMNNVSSVKWDEINSKIKVLDIIRKLSIPDLNYQIENQAFSELPSAVSEYNAKLQIYLWSINESNSDIENKLFEKVEHDLKDCFELVNRAFSKISSQPIYEVMNEGILPSYLRFVKEDLLLLELTVIENVSEKFSFKSRMNGVRNQYNQLLSYLDREPKSLQFYEYYTDESPKSLRVSYLLNKFKSKYETDVLLCRKLFISR